MGFQQELFEVDLERGEGEGSGKNAAGAGTGASAEQAISYALVLLIAANVTRPDESLGKALGFVAAVASVGGAVALARRVPRPAHVRKVLVVLATCWVLYGIRLVHLNTGTRAHYRPYRSNFIHGPASTVIPRTNIHRVVPVPAPQSMTAGFHEHIHHNDVQSIPDVEEPATPIDDVSVAVLGDGNDV